MGSGVIILNKNPETAVGDGAITASVHANFPHSIANWD